MNFDNNIFKLVDICPPNDNNNIIISGLSIKLALTMLLNGAEGESKKELISFLGKSIDELNEDSLKALAGCGENLSLANCFWFAEPNKVKEEFKQIIKKYQDAEIYTDDFDNPETLIKINKWVSDKTKDLIPKVLDELNSNTTSLLINTLYFKDQWSNPISEYLTKDGIFYGLDKQSIVKMMEPRSSFYYENSYAKGFGLTYAKSPFVFIAILPNEEGPVKLENLELQNFNIKEGKYDVHAIFPRLDIEFETELKGTMESIGVVSPFVNRFDFGKMLDIHQVVSKVIHKTKFKLDEKGTEAAAATVVEMVRGIALPTETPTIINLEFNRSFAFMIKNTHTKEILFIGKINNI